MESLIKIQSELKAPKSQFNSFGKYSYRNCEDIFQAVKPLLLKYNCQLTITDNICETGELVYVESTAAFTDGVDVIFVSAQAGIEPNRKGMDIAQSFGSSSSYARKYALSGLFLIDHTKDSDATNETVKEEKPITAPKNIPSIPAPLEERKAKALGKLRLLKTIDTVTLLKKAIEAFRSGEPGGVNIVDGATITDFVEKNTIETISLFYNFVK